MESDFLYIPDKQTKVYDATSHIYSVPLHKKNQKVKKVLP